MLADRVHGQRPDAVVVPLVLPEIEPEQPQKRGEPEDAADPCHSEEPQRRRIRNRRWRILRCAQDDSPQGSVTSPNNTLPGSGPAGLAGSRSPLSGWYSP